MTPYILLFAALLLIYLEFYLPGGIMAAAGVLFLLSGFVLLILENASMGQFLLFLFLTVAGTVFVIKFALWNIKRTSKTRYMYLDSDQQGYRASSGDHEMVGKSGTALCDLHPGGYVLVENRRFSAISVGGYVEKDEEVIVIGGEGETLQVKSKRGRK
jgi:membrane-bound serine protease (ClpP class)